MTTTLAPSCQIADVIEIRHARPMVSSLKIAELFERPHKSVLRSIRDVCEESGGTNKTRETKGFVGVSWGTYVDDRGKEQPAAWLDERSALLVMPFLGGRKAREGQRKLVDAYLYYRDHFATPPRADILAAKRASNRPLTDALVEFLADEGKEPKPRHFSNEARLCNWAVTGSFAPIDEKTLSNEEVQLLEQVRDRDRAFLLAGLDYETRKHRLSSFAIKLRTKLLHSPQDQAA